MADRVDVSQSCVTHVPHEFRCDVHRWTTGGPAGNLMSSAALSEAGEINIPGYKGIVSLGQGSIPTSRQQSQVSLPVSSFSDVTDSSLCTSDGGHFASVSILSPGVTSSVDNFHSLGIQLGPATKDNVYTSNQPWDIYSPNSPSGPFSYSHMGTEPELISPITECRGQPELFPGTANGMVWPLTSGSLVPDQTSSIATAFCEGSGNAVGITPLTSFDGPSDSVANISMAIQDPTPVYGYLPGHTCVISANARNAINSKILAR